VLAAALETRPDLRKASLLLLRHMRQRHDARLRIVDARGALLADSSSIVPADSARPHPPPQTAAAAQARRHRLPRRHFPRAAQEPFLYRLAFFPPVSALARRYLRPPQPPPESDEYYAGARYPCQAPRSRTRWRGIRGRDAPHLRPQSVTLYSAIPVLNAGAVCRGVLGQFPVHVPHAE